MDKAYSTKWDNYSIVTTIVVMVIVAVAVVMLVKEGGWLAISVGILLSLFVLISLFTRTVKTIYRGGYLEVRFLIGKQTLLDTKDYSPMVLQRYPKKSVRLFANGGFWGYAGIWKIRLQKVGRWLTVKSYATNKDEDLVLFVPKSGTGRSILVNIDPNWLGVN